MSLKVNKFWQYFLLIAVFPMLFSSCGIYSFTGASISPEIKTISIQNFYNESGNGPANLSQAFTERLKDYFQQNTNLTLVDADGDLQFEGSITRYDTSPVGAVASENQNTPDEAGQTRLTITVSVSYINVQDSQFDFNRSFSFYDDFNPRTTTLTSAEPGLIDTIFERITFDIFNASVANW
ncbi:MAG: LPS assembly lipoprotein LptE [Bacteroidota bacterium]|nr:LPS assembly lipoprotein LptE [Bacteroidota bacterium]